MGITRAQVSSLSALAEWMQSNAVPSIFKSVAYADSVLTATDAEDNTILSIQATNTGTGSGHFRAYRASANYIGYNLQQFPNSSNPTIEVIGCDNGFMFSCGVKNSSGYNRYISALFTKTNNDKVAVIFSAENSSTTTEALTTALQHVAFGDSATIASTTTFAPESGQQTIMCTFGTNADITDVSYTPKAFYMPIHSAYNSGIGKFLCGGKVYITNGYWCIDTEEDAT